MSNAPVKVVVTDLARLQKACTMENIPCKEIANYPAWDPKLGRHKTITGPQVVLPGWLQSVVFDLGGGKPEKSGIYYRNDFKAPMEPLNRLLRTYESLATAPS